MMDTLRVVLVPVNAKCREIELPIDEDGSCGPALKRLVGERVADVSDELPDKTLGDAVCVYVNAAGMSACPANRAIWATQEMANAGRISPFTGDVVEAGDVADVLYGDFVIVGYDPYEGAECSLTDAECKDAIDLFSGRSGPYSGVSALGYIESTRQSPKRREQDEWDNESSQFDEIICYKKDEAALYNQRLEEEYRDTYDDYWQNSYDDTEW